MVRDVLARTRSGSIVIFHANGRGYKTREALPRTIAGLRKQGFQFSTVSDLLQVKGAKPIIAATCYDVRLGDNARYASLSRKLEGRYQSFYRPFMPSSR